MSLRSIIVLALVLACTSVIILTPGGCFEIGYSQFTKRSLHLITMYWMINRDQGDFDAAAARSALPRQLSAVHHRDLIRRLVVWEHARVGPLTTLLLLWLGIAAAVVCWSRGRRPRLYRGSKWCGLLIAVILAAVHLYPVAMRMIPADHRYLDEFVYVQGLDWSQMSSGSGSDVIIAYEKQGWGQHRLHCVATMDGGVRLLEEAELERRLAGQGLQFQNAADSTENP